MNVDLVKWEKHNIAGNGMGAFIARQIAGCSQIDILTGYFFFDGIKLVQEALSRNQRLILRILVGMDAGLDTRDIACRVYEYERLHPPADASAEYLQQLKLFLAGFPTEQMTEAQAALFQIFAGMIDEGRLQIRKTLIPNHAKLYIFYRDGDISYCAGSSNFTYSGLSARQEFNIHVRRELSGEVANEFSTLWNEALPLIDFSESDKTSESPAAGAELKKVLQQDTPFSIVRPLDGCMKLMREYLKLNRADESLDYRIGEILDSVHYQKFRYQIDAVSRAKRILDASGGVVIADVVGLGKSVMASLLARLTNAPGIVLSPPVLLEGEKGWKNYLKKFRLDEMGWRALSLYDTSLALDEAVQNAQTVVIDEVHNLRNSGTALFQNLQKIISGKRIVCLSATPYNNRPDDLLSILELFPGPEIAGEPKHEYLGRIKVIAGKHRELMAERRNLTGHKLARNTEALNLLSLELRPLIYPLTIRRNRIDLLKNEQYRREVGSLIPELRPPINRKAELTLQQSEFYDAILNRYFAGPNPAFRGAMYKPQTYISAKSALGQIQGNLSSMICRFIVSRWESSPAAFEQTRRNLLGSLSEAGEILKKHGIFCRGVEGHELDEEEVFSAGSGDGTALEFENILSQINQSPRSLVVYAVKSVAPAVKAHCPERKVIEFTEQAAGQLQKDLAADAATLEQIGREFKVCGLGIPENDGKLNALKQILDSILFGSIGEDTQQPGNPRKVLVFTCFADTARYVHRNLDADPRFHGKLLYADGGNVDKSLKSELERHFMCGGADSKSPEKMILVCTDVLSEGINLNQAGVVINYDISYNPVRVIQRLGRINRIDTRVFDRIYNVNFFPTGPDDTHRDINRIEDISVGKMKSIHAILGEDGQILSGDEKPQAFMDKLDPEKVEAGAVSDETRVADLYQQGLASLGLTGDSEIRRYEAMLDELGMRWSIQKGPGEQLYIFSRNKAAIFVTMLPELSNPDNPARSLSCYEAFCTLFNSCKDNPLQASLPFQANPDNRFWKAYRDFRSGNAYVPANIKPAKIQVEALKLVESLPDRFDRAEISGWIKLRKVFAKQVFDCILQKNFEELAGIVEKEREKHRSPEIGGRTQDIMVFGFNLQEQKQ